MSLTTHNYSNNESIVSGIVSNTDGTYLALTPSFSKEFKTVKGAASWLLKKGFNSDGSRIN